MMVMVVTVVVTATKSAAVTAAKSAAVTTAKSAAVATPVSTAVTAGSNAQCGKQEGIGVGHRCQGGQKDLKKEINNSK
jgi:hypothetical protein